MIPGNANPLLLATAADAAAAGPTKSLRFNSGDSAYLSRTPSSNGNRRTFTFSCWVKRSKPVPSGSGQELFRAGDSALSAMNFAPSDGPVDSLSFKADQGGVSPGSATNAVFRDFSAWMHVVYRIDTTQATAADRVRIYVNGVEQTFHTANYPSQNQELKINQSGQPHYIGGKEYFDGYLADIYLIDGSSLDPTSFGAYDDNGVWQAAAYTGTFGTNGFHLLDFENESTIGHDSSGNENDFTANNFVAAAGVALTGARSAAVFFDGVDDKIVYTNDSDLEPGSGNFTLEFFIYKFPNEEAPIYYGTANGHLGIRIHGTGKVFIERIGTAFDHQSSAAVSDETWTHVAISRHAGTMRIYVDGTQISSFLSSQTYTGTFATARTLNDNRKMAISDLHFIKGTGIYTSNFTAPTSISSHANTKLLCFQSSSSATTATVAPSGVTLTATSSPVAGAYPVTEAKDVDVLFDVPTNDTTNTDSGAGGEISGNYATLNALDKGASSVLSNGNLEFRGGVSSAHRGVRSTILPTFKVYAEMTVSNAETGFGLANAGADLDTSTLATGKWAIYNNALRGNGSAVASITAIASGDVVQVAYDPDSNKAWIGKNNSWFDSSGGTTGNPGTGANATFTIDDDVFIFVHSFNDYDTTVNFGARSFSYSAPSGFKALCTTNLPTPTISDGSAYFDVDTYTGTNATLERSNFSFQPDLLWFKARSYSGSHALVDSVRGISKQLQSNTNNAESTNTGGAGPQSFDSDGFTLGTESNATGSTNGSQTYVAWAWDAGSSTVSNTDGDITSSVRANQTAGFSIVAFTATNSNNQTVGHGLNAAPGLIFIKNRDSAENWWVIHEHMRSSPWSDNQLHLNTTDDVTGVYATFNNVAPTSSVINLSNTTTPSPNKGTDDKIMYCIAPVAGFSALGTYEGQGSTDTFVHTGFRSRFILIKNTDDDQQWSSWSIYDTARDTFNPCDATLYANQSQAEGYRGSGQALPSDLRIDILSNGFVLKSNAIEINVSGDTYIYYAIAENPFQANGGLAR